jgi:chorismate synthase
VIRYLTAGESHGQALVGIKEGLNISIISCDADSKDMGVAGE